MRSAPALPLACALAACASATPGRLVERPEGLNVRGDWILGLRGPYAQLRYLATEEGRGLHRGVAIFYPADEREVWICPEEGWGLAPRAPATVAELAPGWRRRNITDLWLGEHRAERSDVVGTWCGEVQISPNGAQVRYERRGILGRDHRVFDVFARSHSAAGEPGVLAPRGAR